MISVLMPTYNCADYISDAIRSILNQTHKDFEFLIIDDGSTDNTADIISKFDDIRIRYIKKEHTGFADSLNYGLRLSKYDLIARMDADDIANPIWLKTSLSYLENSKYDIVSCLVVAFSNNRLLYKIDLPETNEDIVKFLALHSSISHPGCVFHKTKVLTIFGGYDNLGGISDYALWLKLKNKVKFYNIQQILIFYRIRNNSITRINDRIYRNNVYNLQDSYYKKNLIEEFGIHLKMDNTIRGLREYFYGDKRKARIYWLSSLKILLSDYRIVLAFILTFLPENILSLFKKQNLRYRLKYLLSYFSRTNIESRRLLKSLLSD